MNVQTIDLVIAIVGMWFFYSQLHAMKHPRRRLIYVLVLAAIGILMVQNQITDSFIVLATVIGIVSVARLFLKGGVITKKTE